MDACPYKVRGAIVHRTLGGPNLHFTHVNRSVAVRTTFVSAAYDSSIKFHWCFGCVVLLSVGEREGRSLTDNKTPQSRSDTALMSRSTYNQIVDLKITCFAKM